MKHLNNMKKEKGYEIYTDGGREFKIKKGDPKIKAKDIDPDWSGKCEICSQSPIVPITGMCGPCTWGESETTGGNW